jgi:glycine hydroxymethyltransferase
MRDVEIFNLIQQEELRQKNHIELIASENFVSEDVLKATGSILTNKYAEGYSSKRFYNGCQYVDEIENLANSRLQKLFGAKYTNVQPHSGSQANQAAFLALLNPSDSILGMSLDAGGHLTHGAKPNLSGKWFNANYYSVNKDTYLIDMNEVLDIAKKTKPKLIIAGFSAYPRKIDFKAFRDVANQVGAYLMADIAHISGIIAKGFHESPMDLADVVTSTTHKTLRGPRGGIIMTNNEDVYKKINSALFPGIQGGPLMHVIAGKAVAFKEALSNEFTTYIDNVLINNQVLSQTLKDAGLSILTSGSDNHITLVDLRRIGLTGKEASNLLEEVNITCNKNAIPFDDTSPFVTSGIRLGTPAITTKGFSKEDTREVARCIIDILLNAKSDNIESIKKSVKERVVMLTNKTVV